MFKEGARDECNLIWEGNLFSVALLEVGSDRMGVIRALRATTRLSLMTIRRLVENAPKTVIEGLTRHEAERVRNILVATGATAEIKNLGGIRPQ